jgi:anti-sigma-K factor RskA
MNCPIKTHENTDWLLDYSAGKLNAERSALVERHVETCLDCARLVEGQRVVWSALGQWEPQDVSADFNRRLYQRIDQVKPATWLDRLIRPLQPLWRPVVPLAAACLLIVAGVALHAPEAAVHRDNAQARIETIEPEQVERTLDDMQMLRELAVPPQPEQNTPRPM